MPAASLAVMTRNLYLGADITLPLMAVALHDGRAAVTALAHATFELRATRARTRFDVRARLLAAEIAAAAPDLVGLQEAALWRLGPLGPDHLGVPDATDDDEDFLAMLLAALDAAGSPYDVVTSLTGADVEAPCFAGPLTDPGPDACDLRLTLRDVILARRGSPVTVTGAGGSQFRAQLQVDIAGRPTRFGHGYAWADVEVAGSAGRFITTHLDSESLPVMLDQADELVGATRDLPGWVVLVGDLNSDPALGPSALDGLTSAGGFTDAARLGAAEPTFGFGELLDDESADGFGARIDHILVRGPGARVQRVWRTGVSPADRDPATGLWPSDHAGVVALLEIG